MKKLDVRVYNLIDILHDKEIMAELTREKQMEELTYGEKAVGLEFNPSGDSDITQVKIQIANLIDILNNFRTYEDNPEIKRMLSISITELQTAQMWAVKALTWKY